VKVEIFFLVTNSQPERFLQVESVTGLLGPFETAYKSTSAEHIGQVWARANKVIFPDSFKCVSVKWDSEGGVN